MLSNFYPYLVENGFNQKLLFCTSHDAHAQSQQHEDTLNSVCAHKEEEEEDCDGHNVVGLLPRSLWNSCNECPLPFCSLLIYLVNFRLFDRLVVYKRYMTFYVI